MSTPAGHDPEAVLDKSVYAGGRAKPFREVTAEEVRARADELRAATGWGPTAKIAAVAMAWGELSRLMHEAGASTVGDLDPKAVTERAERLWVMSPGGSLLL